MNKIWISTLTSVLVGLLALPLGARNEKGKGREKDPSAESRRGLAGIVVSVSPGSRRITITTKPSDKEVRYDVAKNARIKIHGKPASLDDIKRGMHVTLVVNKSRTEVVKISAHTSKSEAETSRDRDKCKDRKSEPEEDEEGRGSKSKGKGK